MIEKKILIVEDNPDDFELILRAFQKSNITNEIIPAHDGAEALDYLFFTEAAGDSLSVVLLDLKLPKISGLEVLQCMRSNMRTKLIPVVVLTASKEEHDLIDSYKLGANSYVRKPFDINQFVEAAGQLGLYWLVLNEPPIFPPLLKGM